jgi:predicted nucleotidyltransferase
MTTAPEPEALRRGQGLQAALRSALQRHPGVRLALLFGSEARGQATESSDVDVAILAPGQDLLELASCLSEATGREVDVVGLDDPGVPLLEELMRDSKPLHEAFPGAYGLWRSRALSLLDIDGPGYARMRDAWLERVAREGI